MYNTKVQKILNCNVLEYVFFTVCIQNMFLLIKTSDLVVKISDYHSVIQNIRFLQRNGCTITYMFN